MTIHNPRIVLSENDKRLLLLISNLIIKPTEQAPSNVPDAYVSITDVEAEQLADLLEKLLGSDQFRHSRNFIQEASVLGNHNDKKARQLYATGLRDKNPNTTIITHHRWYELQARLGKKHHQYMGKIITPMSAEHFFNMEYRLFQSLNINPRVIDLLMKLGKERQQVLHQFHEGTLKHVDISRAVHDLQSKAKNNDLLSRINLTAVAFVIANIQILFTTRDWTATGTWSCIVGNAINIFSDRDRKI